MIIARNGGFVHGHTALSCHDRSGILRIHAAEGFCLDGLPFLPLPQRIIQFTNLITHQLIADSGRFHPHGMPRPGNREKAVGGMCGEIPMRGGAAGFPATGM